MAASLMLLSACGDNSTAVVNPGTGPGTNGGVATNPNAKVRLGYLYTDNAEAIASIDWTRYNHVAVFGGLAPQQEDGSIYRFASYGNVPLSMPVWGPNSPFKAKYINELKAKGMKVLLVLGGAGSPSTDIAVVCKDPSKRANMVTQLRELVNGTLLQQDGSVVQDVPFDGLDVDWEFPTTVAEKDCLNGLMGELRAALPNKLLTVAVSYSSGYYKVPELVAQNLDWIGLMTYDYGLSASSPDHSPYGKSVQAVQNWMAAGVPANKLLLGIAAYGKPTSNTTVNWKDVAGNPAYAPYFSSFDSTKAKAEYVAAQGLKGVMYWEVSQDSYGTGLGFSTWMDEFLKVKGL